MNRERGREHARQRANEIANAILAGFDRHYALFRYNAQQAKSRFECGDWVGIQRLARDRIAFYDKRVNEAFVRIQSEFRAKELDARVWPQVKRDYVALLADHRQPELAETFFNSVCTKILHRSYFHNDIIFVRPAVSVEYLDSDPPSYRVYYPSTSGWKSALRQLVIDIGFACPFVDVERDLGLIFEAAGAHFSDGFTAATDCQLQVLRTPFFRNKGAYVIGRLINDGELIPFALPVLQDSHGRLYIDTILFGAERIEALFNFSRAYFMVDMDVPSAYVLFLKTLMPTKPESELYTMLGLHKQGKTLFYRDLLHHLRYSTDRFIVAPGIKGLVMTVFTLPSFPYVFKVIKDKRGKDMTREFIAAQYQLVKFHDRVGRMADTWEYSGVPFPKDRLDPELVAELMDTAPSIIDDDGDALVIRHVYIERRMIPLNIYLEHASESEREHALIEYGQAIKDMVAANIFPGDMLYKNFGMTRQGRVVFYDYDEVAYITDCNFRRIPEPMTPEQEMAAEPWYTVGPNDVFPEEFETFLLGNPLIRDGFMRHHAELLDASYWQERQRRIREGMLEDVFPYPDALRFRHRLARRATQPEATPAAASVPTTAAPRTGAVAHATMESPYEH
ncbi:MAG: bifunctional isocitrate dehydrogenase kinase/phosphatase [Burkholderiaceae bacterium]|nr:bifunctional isocitrate dehydrogenase kinase/phosphatase [Burkholderiaceae bacterium]